MIGAFAGHDHDNDYAGSLHGIRLGYGRVSGYGGYGSLQRGVEGVAVSTWISRAAAMIAYWIVCSRRLDQPVRLMHPLRMRGTDLRLIFKRGIPSAGEHVSYNLSQVVITYLVAMLGAAALTTKIYTQNITSFVFVFSMAIGQGTQIIVGHFIGSMRKEEAYHSGIRHLKLGAGVTLGFSLLLYALSGPLIGFFTSDPQIIQLGRQLMLLSVLLEPARACNMVLISSLNAGGTSNSRCLSVLSRCGESACPWPICSES